MKIRTRESVYALLRNDLALFQEEFKDLRRVRTELGIETLYIIPHSDSPAPTALSLSPVEMYMRLQRLIVQELADREINKSMMRRVWEK